jgi:hypothetical protein
MLDVEQRYKRRIRAKVLQRNPTGTMIAMSSMGYVPD